VLSSKAFLVTLAALYACAFLTVPFLYYSLRPAHAAAPIAALAVDSGTQLASGGSSRSSSSSRGGRPQLTVVGSRRLALERPGAVNDAAMWPDTGLAQHNGSKIASLPRVEFRDAGAAARQRNGGCMPAESTGTACGQSWPWVGSQQPWCIVAHVSERHGVLNCFLWEIAV
jgi:hypothetical protein